MKDHLYAHTGLRGLAALLVVPSHIGAQFLIGEGNFNLLSKNILGVIPSVDLFFMLSGFILAYSYITNAETISWRNFFVARFARLYPLHLMILSVVIAMIVSANLLGFDNKGYDFKELPIQLSLLQSLPLIELDAWNGPSWSVSMELFGYIVLFPILYYLGKVKALRHSFPFLLIVSVIGISVIYNYGSLLFDSFITGWGGFMRLFCFFIAGFALENLTRQYEKLTKFLVRYNSIILVLVTLTLIILSQVHSLQWLKYFMIALLLWAFAKNSDSLGSKILGSKCLVFLGLISYSIYMWHSLIGKIINGLPERFTFWTSGSITGWFLFIGIHLFLVYFSWLSYHYYEKRARKFIVEKFNSKKVL